MDARPWPWEIAAAAFAGAAFFLAFVFAERGLGPASPPAPGSASASRAGGIAQVQAPPASAWDEWWADDSNPFVPWQQRRTRPATGGAPPPPLPPGGPARQDDPVAPALRLPAAVPGGGGAPRAVGSLRSGGRITAVMLRFPGSAEPRAQSVGDTIAGWTIEAVEAGGVVRCRAPDGREHRLLIGD